MFEKLIFVEGPSDEEVVREWAGTLGINLSKASVGFIKLGGSRNIHHFAAHQTTSFLQKRGVGLWFLLDRDESDSEEIATLKDRLGANCNLRVLPAREIENLLVKPGADCRYVAKFKTSDSTIKEPTPEEMSRLIDSCADTLKDYAFVKRVSRVFSAPIYISPEFNENIDASAGIDLIKKSLGDGGKLMQDRTTDIDARLPLMRESFDAAWKDNKLAVVSGDELLRAILRPFDMSFRKRRDSRRIASMMTKEEIPVEVRNMLGELAG